jgi:hypothetical protein
LLQADRMRKRHERTYRYDEANDFRELAKALNESIYIIQ